MQEKTAEAARLLKAIGNPQRLRLLCLLYGQELSVSQLNERIPALSQSALSQHLARLREEGLVHTRREAQTIWYELADGPARQIISVLYENFCQPAPGHSF
ncbi:metalloregulator ArsR/SmtB family transcription factor [Oleiagrimonas sp. C23AA]|uniref:ArsR/SmtB family transcription factor n=1 Tax=Oleiagrimonas sp. C23AA TaxID=2719047 RepID=UPI0014239C97|nr:metalloregulator ArsR/SmtB family transcription factor [Oleiagrimonas sp. C23AA]NII11837.1 winged helix-turn-helix transcriptional regulator [Oleiagrimonas sp. C23AA]